MNKDWTCLGFKHKNSEIPTIKSTSTVELKQALCYTKRFSTIRQHIKDKFKLDNRLWKSIERHEVNRVRSILNKVISNENHDFGSENKNFVMETDNLCKECKNNEQKENDNGIHMWRQYPGNEIENPIFGRTFYLENQKSCTQHWKYTDNWVTHENVFARCHWTDSGNIFQQNNALFKPKIHNFLEEPSNGSNMMRLWSNKNDETSDFDIDHFLLGSKRNEQDSIISTIHKENNAIECKSHILVDRFENNHSQKTNGYLNQHHPLNSNRMFLSPHYKRCSTGDKQRSSRRKLQASSNNLHSK